MAKAVVLQPGGFYIDNGNYTLVLDVVVTDGAKWYTHMNVQAVASSMKPLAPSWQTIVRDAVVLQAQQELGAAVDEVMFPDFSVLGIV